MIDAELVDAKLQSLCGSGFSVCCAHAFHALPFRSELTNNTLQNQRWVHFFTLNFECHNRYNKLLLCNYENSDIA